MRPVDALLITITVILLFIQLYHEHLFFYRMMYERWANESLNVDCRHDESEKSTSAKITASTICLVSSSTSRVVIRPTLKRSNDNSRIFSSAASCDVKYVSPDFEHVESPFGTTAIAFQGPITIG